MNADQEAALVFALKHIEFYAPDRAICVGGRWYEPVKEGEGK